MIHIKACTVYRLGKKEYTKTVQLLKGGPMIEAELTMIMENSELPAEISPILQGGFEITTYKFGVEF